MSKDARNPEDLELSPEAAAKFQELVALLSAEGFGPDGPPIDTTFAEIEAFGHSTGRMLARAVDQHLTSEHARHFDGENVCPTCRQECSTERKERLLQTEDGEIGVGEPACRCSVCNRAFFPSADGAAT